MFGHKAKLHHAKRHAEKIQMKKTLKAHDERQVKQKDDGAVKEGALPTYLLDREGQKDAKALSSAVKDRRKDKAAKFAVPLPKVRGIAEEEMFKVIKTGKSKGKSWKRMVSKPTFVGENFTRKPVKLEVSGIYSQRGMSLTLRTAVHTTYGACKPFLPFREAVSQLTTQCSG